MAKTETKTINTDTSDSEIQNTLEAEYSADELASASLSVFGKDVSPDCVIAALHVAGIKKTTKTTAKRIVSEFLKKEVK